jgi:hypothetical protein
MDSRAKAVRGQTWRFDDIPLGYVHTFGASTLTRAEIEEFCTRFGPHLPLAGQSIDRRASPPAAQAHIYALWTRMLWEETKEWPVLARLGQDALRWYKTAHDGDTLNVRMTFVSKDAVNDERGIVIASHEVLNQAGELIMAVMTRTAMARRPI